MVMPRGKSVPPKEEGAVKPDEGGGTKKATDGPWQIKEERPPPGGPQRYSRSGSSLMGLLTGQLAHAEIAQKE